MRLPKSKTKRKKPSANEGKKKSGIASGVNATELVAAVIEEIAIGIEIASEIGGEIVKKKMKTTAGLALQIVDRVLRWLLPLPLRLHPEVVPVTGLNPSLDLHGALRRITCVRKRRRRKHWSARKLTRKPEKKKWPIR